MAEFVRNPAFRAQLDAALFKGMADVVRATATEAKKGLSPQTIIRKAPIVTEGPKREANGDISGVVKYGKGLGPIFERGTKQRFTRAGAGRGAITTQNNAMQRARESAIRRGLDLGRYL
jgi:hypothetical protein